MKKLKRLFQSRKFWAAVIAIATSVTAALNREMTWTHAVYAIVAALNFYGVGVALDNPVVQAPSPSTDTAMMTAVTFPPPPVGTAKPSGGVGFRGSTALALLALAVASAAAIPPPTVTFTPSPVAPGGTVQMSVQMKGNDNLPPVDHLITVDCQYYEENATNPTILPQVKSTLTVSGIPGALIKSVTWRMSLPPNFTYLTDPVSTGYMGASTVKGNGILDFTATALLSGVTATTTWTMRAQ